MDAMGWPQGMIHNFRTEQDEVVPEQFTDENVRDYIPQGAIYWNIYVYHRRKGIEPAQAMINTLKAVLEARGVRVS